MQQKYPCPYCKSKSIQHIDSMQYNSQVYPCSYCANSPLYQTGFPYQFANQPMPFTVYAEDTPIKLQDYGPKPFAVNIEEATKQNDAFRTALWTGDHLQLTLMSLKIGEDIGLEIHPDLDQFIRIEEGQGLVKMGNSRDNLNYQQKVYDDFAFIIPAGTWHNLINTGNKPLKLYSIYAPVQHPYGTVHETKAAAEAAEEHHK